MEMEWLDYLLEGVLAIVVAGLIAWSIADIASRAARVVLCVAALVTITGILYSAFTLAVNGLMSGATGSMSSINTASGGALMQIASAVMPSNLITCMGVVFAVMVARLIYDWNVEFITRICG